MRAGRLVCLAALGVLVVPFWPVMGQGPASFPFPSVPDGGPESRLPPRQLTVTVRSGADGRPVVGARFFGSYLTSDENDGPGGEMPVTDEQGTATLSFRFPAAGSGVVSNVWLTVTHTNHAQRTIAWTAPADRFLGEFPTNYTIRFAALTTIGGFVRDAAGRPVKGAQVRVMSGRPSPSGGGAAVRTEEYSVYYSERSPGIVTDANGFWTASTVPVDLETVGLAVMRADGAMTRFGTGGGTNDTPVDLAALRRTNAVLTLAEGATVRGIVVDEAGQPVPGARLVEEQSWWSVDYHGSTNRSDGRFELPHRTPGPMQLSIDSPRHARLVTNFVFEPNQPELRFVLRPARVHRLAMTVLDTDGRPVAGATFFGSHLLGSELGDGRPTTDEQGRATLVFRYPMENSVAFAFFSLYVAHSNHLRRTIQFTAPPDRFFSELPTSYTLRFPGMTTFGGFVRDETGRPMTGARVRLERGEALYGERFETSGLREVTDNYRSRQVTTDANGFWSIDRVPMDLDQVSAVVQRPDGQVDVFGSSDRMGDTLVDMAALRRTNAILTLPRTFTVRGVVVDEAGQPVTGVRLREEGVRWWRSRAVTNGPDGRFQLPRQTGSRLLLAAESESYQRYTTNMTLSLDTPETEVRLVLPKRLQIQQHVMTVTVLDGASGRPVAGARFHGAELGRDDGNGDGGRVTDEQGRVRLEFRLSEDRLLNSRSVFSSTRPGGGITNWSRSTVRLSVVHSNYAQRSISWSAPSDQLASVLPTNYTLRFPAAVTLGGYVRNDSGRPVVGARMELSGGRIQSGDPVATSVDESSEFYTGMSGALVTDTNGFWTVPRVPVDLGYFNITVIRPGGAGSSFSTARNMGDAYVDMAELQRTNAVLQVPDGVTVRGLVVDDAGQPVPGVRLRERSARTGRSYYLTNGPDGRFELAHRTGMQLQILADSPRHALLVTNVTLDPAKPELTLVLSRQRPARLRVVNEKGNPVARAYVSPLEWRNAGQNYEWTGTTDREGRLTWTNAPASRIIVMISGEGGSRRLRWNPGDTEVVVRLERSPPNSAALRMKVTEAGTGKPVPGATVLRTVGYGRAPTELGATGPDGVLETTVRATNPGEREQSFTLSVRGDGYFEWLGEEQFVLAEGDIEQTAILKKGRAAGVVLSPDGQPVAGAKVLLTRSEMRLYSYRPGEFAGSNSRDDSRTTTRDGAFSFPPAAADARLIAAHPSGFASVTLEELGDSGKLALQPWGRIEGVLQVAGKPVARQRVTLRSPLNPAYVDSYSFNYSTTTDQSGRFVFTNIPPGEHLLTRQLGSPRGSSVDSHRRPVTLAAGETQRVNYEFGGRLVTGFVDADADVDWTLDAHVLEAKSGRPPPEPIQYGMSGPGSYERMRRAHGRSAAVREYERKLQHFQLVFDRDGAFRIEDVPPGTYELRLRALEPLTPEERSSGRSGERAEIATLTREIVVPDGPPGSEIDLGTFRVEAKSPASPSSAAPPMAFRATTLDGRPFDLDRLRGRPTVVVFWADWAPRSGGRLDELHVAASRLSSGTNVALISVNLDEDPSVARQNAQRLGPGWTHLRLEGSARFEVTEQLGIDTLPAAFLLDARGAVLARDPSGRRLAAVLSRTIKPSSPP